MTDWISSRRWSTSWGEAISLFNGPSWASLPFISALMLVFLISFIRNLLDAFCVRDCRSSWMTIGIWSRLSAMLGCGWHWMSLWYRSSLIKVRSIVDWLAGPLCHVTAPGGVATHNPPAAVISSISSAGASACTCGPPHWGWWRLRSPRRA